MIGTTDALIREVNQEQSINLYTQTQSNMAFLESVNGIDEIDLPFASPVDEIKQVYQTQSGQVYIIAEINAKQNTAIYKLNQAGGIYSVETIDETLPILTNLIVTDVDEQLLLFTDIDATIYDFTALPTDRKNTYSYAGSVLENEKILDIEYYNSRLNFILSGNPKVYWSSIYFRPPTNSQKPYTMKTFIDELAFIRPDINSDLPIAFSSNQGTLYVASYESIQLFSQSVSDDLPIQPLVTSTINMGIADEKHITNLNNYTYIIGNNTKSIKSIYRISGSQIERLSNNYIDSFITNDVELFSFFEFNKNFLAMLVPNIGCFVYDLETQQWHKRFFDVRLIDSNLFKDSTHRWLYNKAIVFNNTIFINTTYPTNKLTKISNNSAVKVLNMPAPYPLHKERISKYFYANNTRFFMTEFVCECQKALNITNDADTIYTQGKPELIKKNKTIANTQSIAIEFSDDECRTWRNTRTFEWSQGEIGKRLKLFKVGSSRKRAFKIYSDTIDKMTFSNFSMDIR